MAVLLDTDHFSLDQEDIAKFPFFQKRLLALPQSEIQVSIISFQEQSRGWLAWINSAKKPKQLVLGFRQLQLLIRDYSRMSVLPFGEAAFERFAPGSWPRRRRLDAAMTDSSEVAALEADPNWPSGPWTGYFLQPSLPGKHRMELHLTFQNGAMTGAGRDWVGSFTIRGKYQAVTGNCHWTKRYLGKHDVFYKGFNEGKGIWGVWEILPEQNLGIHSRGGFHIWPEGMPDPAGDRLAEEADLPVEAGELVTADR